MNRLLVLTFSGIFFLNTFCSSAQPKVDFVNLFIGTAGDHGQLDPSATVPFGMVKLGPDTDPVNHSGYNYEAEYIQGFSHNRIAGVGCRGAGGNFRILPGTGQEITRTKYNKASEAASPGFYAVELANNIKVQLTATNTTGVHRYTFPKSSQAYLMIDYKASFAGTHNARYEQLSNKEINAVIEAKNVCGVGRYRTNFYLESSKAFDRLEEKDGLLYAYFATAKNEVVELRVGLSPISPQQAKREMSQLSFEKIRENASNAWENILNRIEVDGKQEYKILFYTHLYHTMLNPVNTTTSSGTFMGTDWQLYQADGYIHYDTWSMWDNFRNKFSLYALVIPGRASDIGKSLVDLYTIGRSKWTSFFEPAPSVRTEHAAITLLDLHRRGIKGIDLEKAYVKMAYEASYIEKHSPDTRLENAYDYWALAQVAGELGKASDKKMFLEKAMEYKGHWRKTFLKMEDDADIMHARGLYEGTIWQYRWHVQFDIPGIIDMMGGQDKYIENLTYFFDNDLYNHGNQPDIHVPHMFNIGGAPWLTQKWVNRILTKADMVQYYGTHNKWDKPYIGRVYKAAPKGYIREMDDDEGTMSSWYVLSAMGLYPVLVGDPVFQVNTPIFDRVTINLENGKTFEIVTEGLSDENFYIQSASLNGQPFDQSYIEHQQLAEGGKLIYYLGHEPNKAWGVK